MREPQEGTGAGPAHSEPGHHGARVPVTTSTTFVPPANFLTDLIDEHIEALEEPREPDGKWHPSSYWGCDRKVIYEVRGVEQTNPADVVSKRRFRIGHILHEFVQGALLSAPELVEVYPEFTLESKLEEAGHGDALIHYVNGDVDIWFVLEAKSSRKSSFKFGLKEDHAKQGSSYAVSARTMGVWVEDPSAPEGKRWIDPLGDKLAGVLVLYLEKEDLHTQEYWLPYDEAWETRLQERLAHLETYRADPESLPPRLPMSKRGGKLVKNWMCGGAWGSCPFFDRCWKQDGGAVKPTDATDVPAVFEW